MLVTFLAFHCSPSSLSKHHQAADGIKADFTPQPEPKMTDRSYRYPLARARRSGEFWCINKIAEWSVEAGSDVVAKTGLSGDAPIAAYFQLVLNGSDAP
jgi:hypothetical protein